MRLGKNELRMSSKTIISCSINFNVMEEVFKKSYTYFKDGPYFMGSSDTLLIVLIKKEPIFGLMSNLTIITQQSNPNYYHIILNYQY